MWPGRNVPRKKCVARTLMEIPNQMTGVDRRLRRIVIALALVSALVGGCRRGETASESPAVVAGSSMAPCLRGEYVRFQCPDCRFSFSADAARPPVDGRAVCPNCGLANINWSSGQRRSADSVGISPISDPIHRWSIVAIKTRGGQPDEFVVKRVVGLPGETVALAGGDVLVNGRPQFKPWPVQKEMRIPVFDSEFLPPAQGLDRSRARLFFRSDEGARPNDESRANDDPDGLDGWEPLQRASGYNLAQSPIVYRHQPGYRANPGLKPKGVIQDDYAYNQNLSRSLHEVDQLFVQLEVESETGKVIELVLPRSAARLRCMVEVDGSVMSMLQTGGQRWNGRWQTTRPGGPVSLSIELSNFDRAWVVAVNRTIVIHQAADSDSSNSEVDAPWGSDPLVDGSFPSDVALVVSATEKPGRWKRKPVQLRRLRIWRDVYYYDETGTLAPPGLAVPDDGLIVLGDNVPRSDDSRYWNPPWIRRDSIVGEVRR